MIRNRWNIYAEMLTIAGDPIAKTRLMYRANLSYKLTNICLDVLLRNGLLRVTVNPHRRYHTTEKGEEWLEQYNRLPKI